MPLSPLSGSKVLADEDEARAAYPYVCWEHPQLYPGIMCPVWAVELREAYNRVNLAAFGREMLKHVAKMFPKEEPLMDGEEPCDPDDAEAVAKVERQRIEDREREEKGLMAVQAVIAVLDSYAGPISQGSAENVDLSIPARNALALRTLDVFEMGGMRYARPDRVHDDVKTTERARLLQNVRLPGRNIPRARAL